jgi:hypothetical protein
MMIFPEKKKELNLTLNCDDGKARDTAKERRPVVRPDAFQRLLIFSFLTNGVQCSSRHRNPFQNIAVFSHHPLGKREKATLGRNLLPFPAVHEPQEAKDCGIHGPF